MTARDEESAVIRRRRKKCFAYIAVGVVLQMIIIAVLAVTVLRIKRPSAKVNSVMIQNLNTTQSPSFNMNLAAEIAVKNTNFGHFKFEDSVATFSYQGITVGQGFISAARAKARSTRRIVVTVDLSSAGLSGVDSILNNEINSGVLTLGAYTKLSGKVEVFKIMKKSKSTEMNCILFVSLRTQSIIDFTCQ